MSKEESYRILHSPIKMAKVLVKAIFRYRIQNRSAIKMNLIDDLPILPFEKILGYLSLEDRVRSRGVSRYWRDYIDSFRVESLGFSQHPIGLIEGKSRWVSGAFAQNFIRTSRVGSFLSAFSRSILSNLKHLRLCDLVLSEKNVTTFVRILSSFGQLEELDIIRFAYMYGESDLELNLPMIKSVQLEQVRRVRMLILKTPKLQQIKIANCPSVLRFFYCESVERLTIGRLELVELKQMKNLKYLCIKNHRSIDPSLLSGLEQLKEIHLNKPRGLWKLFNQKERYNRADLKIYLRGLLLLGPDDPAIVSFGVDNDCFSRKAIAYMAENRWRLADEIPFCKRHQYMLANGRVAPELELNIVNRFTDLNAIEVGEPVQDVQRFLEFLKNFGQIQKLTFSCDQPTELFDRLPDHCAVQWLTICRPSAPSAGFLFKLKNLTYLEVGYPVNAIFILVLFENLPFLLKFSFLYNRKRAIISYLNRKHFEVSITGMNFKPTFSDLVAAILFIVENTLK